MKCNKHPDYKAIYKPRTACIACEVLFALKEFYRQDKKQQKGNIKLKLAKRTFVSPRGKRYSTTNLAQLARRFKLTRTGLSKVVHGHQTNHKGWRLA